VAPDGTLWLDWPRPAEPGPNGWHESYRFHQPDLEHLLRARLTQQPEIQVVTGAEVTSLTQHPTHVTLDIAGAQSAIQAKFVVGCDGASSLTRAAMGTSMDDLGFAERWLVVDLLLKTPRPDLGDHTVQFCNPDRAMTYCRNPGHRRRWEIAVKPGESDADITAPARIWDLLSRWITPDEAELERHAVYTFRSMIARAWRDRRVMIAGDAAHLTPPFMGQGLCAGIRDAANLAWKLALVVQGHAQPDLMGTYQSERAPHARRYIETAIELGQLINAINDTNQPRQFRSIQPRLGPSDFPQHLPDPLRGQLFPQPMLADGRMLDDAAGYAPVLLTRTRLVDPTPIAIFDGQTHPNIAHALNALGCAAVLLRPDRYIAASARTPGELAELLTIQLSDLRP